MEDFGYNSGTKRNMYYVHSGSFPVYSIFLTLLFGVLGAAVLGLIYSYLVVYIPYVYIRCILTFGFGYLVGMAAGYGALFGKMRNTKLAIVFGVISGIIAEYFNWVFWIMVMCGKSNIGKILIFNPLKILDYMSILSITGVWSIKSTTPTGVALYIIWFLEAAIIIVFAAFGAYSKIKDKPFCEKCDCWVNKKIVISNLEFIQNFNSMKSQLEISDFSSIKSLKRVLNGSNHTNIELLYCDECHDYFLINVYSIIYVINNKQKKPQAKVIGTVKNLQINREAFDEIRSSYSV